MPLALPAEIDLVLRAPLAAARASGLPIVGFMSNNVPVELIHAAGCFPLQIPTGPRAATPRADRYLEPRFDPLVRSALEWLLEEGGDALAMVVLPRANDSMQRLYYYLCELRRSFGERLPEPVLYDLLHTPWYSSAAYNHARTAELAARLAALGGRAIDDARLGAAIADYDAVRARLAQLAARRRRVPCGLAGADARAVFLAAQRLAPDRLCAALDALLAEDPAPAAGVRTVLAGSAHDTPALHQLVAEAGGQVVCDRHWLGDDLFGPAFDARLAPLRAVTAHYHRHSPSARSFPPAPAALAQAAEEARAEAAVFFYYAEEEALTWDHQAERAALTERGIPTLLLPKQPYPASRDAFAPLRAFFAELGRERGVRA